MKEKVKPREGKKFREDSECTGPVPFHVKSGQAVQENKWEALKDKPHSEMQ